MSQRESWFDRFSAAAGVLVSLWLGFGALTQPPRPRSAAVTPPGLASLTAPQLPPCVLDGDGYWQGSVTGSARLDIDWRGAALACDGSARPDGRGLRLFFAGPSGTGTDRLVLVLGISAGLRELAGREHTVTVTLIDEASSTFFHAGDGRCFTRVDAVTPLPAETNAWRVQGEFYCTGAIAALTGERAVTLGDSRYAGRLTLEAE